MQLAQHRLICIGIGICTCTLNPQPSTLNPQPFTLNPQSSTLNLQPATCNLGCALPLPFLVQIQSHFRIQFILTFDRSCACAYAVPACLCLLLAAVLPLPIPLPIPSFLPSFML